MAIAGVGILQSREFHARADSRLHPRKSGTEQRRHVFFDHRDDPFADHVLPSESPLTCETPKGVFSETSVRAGQGAVGAHFRWPRIRAFARMRSFRMIATMATLAGFPALIMAWYLVLNSGLHRMALRAGM
jgi:hypothetical protein